MDSSPVEPQIQLTPEQKTALVPHLENFRAYLKSDSFQQDQRDRIDRVRFFQKELPSRLEELSEADIEEIVTKLWATRIWGNQLYHVQKIISDNGIEKIKRHLYELLDPSKGVPQRYEAFLNAIKRLGPASITEILCYLHPDQCGIWNKVAREALTTLGLDNFVKPTKYKLSAAEYDVFNQVLKSVAGELRSHGFEHVDLLFVDFFLYNVTETIEESPPTVVPEEDFDHDEVRDLIDQIGSSLGFDTDTEVAVAHGARVDAVWRARIGNLGLVTYVFEVHRKGSIDSLLLNLQKANSSPTVQKVIAVSDQAQLYKIKKESEGLPEEFRRAIGFWPVLQVEKVGENLQEAMEIINSLGLVQGEF